jgi:hypothetical protein
MQHSVQLTNYLPVIEDLLWIYHHEQGNVLARATIARYSNFLTNLFLRILAIIIRNNIYSLQTSTGCNFPWYSHGHLAACAHATLTFGHFKNIVLLLSFNANLIQFVPLAEWSGLRFQSSELWVHIPPRGPVCMYWLVAGG